MSMEHIPGRGLNVEAPPVDSSLARGFRAERKPFLSYGGVSVSSAPANGSTDVCSFVCVSSHLASLWDRAVGRYLCMNNMTCTCKVGEVHILCRSRSPCFSSSSFVSALPSAVDFLSVSDSRVSVCASVHCLVLLTFLKSADC